jgi:hypothetical protein
MRISKTFGRSNPEALLNRFQRRAKSETHQKAMATAARPANPIPTAAVGALFAVADAGVDGKARLTDGVDGGASSSTPDVTVT